MVAVQGTSSIWLAMPMVVCIIPAIIAGVGLLVTYIGSRKAGNASKRASESAAERDEWNAGIAELQAEDAIARGRDEESRFRTGVRRLIGSQRASFAAQGVKVNVGSAADVQGDSAYLGELDARQIRSNAEREAWGYQVEAADRRRMADIARKGGQAAQTASRWQGASTALTGASMVADRYGWGGRSGGTR